MLEKDPEQRFDINEVDNELRRIDRQNFTKGYKIVKFKFLFFFKFVPSKNKF